MRGPSYLGLTRSLSWWPLMPWLLTSPGHQQPWYWLCRIRRSCSYLRKDFKYLCQNRVGFLPEETYFFRDTRKKVEETYFFQFCPDKTGRNWTKLEKTMKEVRNPGKNNYHTYLITYKRLLLLRLQMHLVNWYCLKPWCKKINYFWTISSSFIQTKLEETGWQLGKV